MTLKENLSGLIFAGMIGASALGVISVYNRLLNDRTINKSKYITVSRVAGLFGHIEYTRYFDGSRDIKEYPGIFTHRYLSSDFYQDLQGDGLVDRIRENGSEFLLNRFGKLLVRESDYSSHKKEFDKADKKLQRLMARYDR